MGSTCSHEAVAVASASSVAGGTAKVVRADGELEEFRWPVKASQVLGNDPTCFMCHSDDMGFDGLVTAVGADEELQPGHLYFVLPISSLRRRMRPDEMAALANRASAALRRNGYARFLADDCGPRPADYSGRRPRIKLQTIDEQWDW